MANERISPIRDVNPFLVKEVRRSVTEELGRSFDPWKKRVERQFEVKVDPRYRLRSA